MRSKTIFSEELEFFFPGWRVNFIGGNLVKSNYHVRFDVLDSKDA